MLEASGRYFWAGGGGASTHPASDKSKALPSGSIARHSA
jgi:hypothetical protein